VNDTAGAKHSNNLVPEGIIHPVANCLAFKCFDYERTWWRLFQKMCHA